MERIVVDINKAYDIYDDTEVSRKVVMRHVVINDEDNFININLRVKHYLIIDNILIHAPKRYADLEPTITAREGQLIYLENNNIHIFKEEDIQLWGNAELGVNSFPIMTYIAQIRKNQVIFDDFVTKVIQTSASDGDYDIHPALKYLL